MNTEEMNKKISRVIAKAWSDAEFKDQLLKKPVEILRAEGIDVPAGIKVTVVENTEKQHYLLIPPKPEELSDEQLDVAAGGAWDTIKWHVCFCW